MAKNKKANDKKLAEGAKDIRKAEKQAADEKPLVIPKNTRPIQDILKDHVIVLPGHIGLTMADDTPVQESLEVLRWTIALSDHSQFMIGDVMNFGHKKWGQKPYDLAVKQTGLMRQTLWQYASVARRIAPDKRKPALTFEHHREILRLGDGELESTLVSKTLNEVAGQAEKGVAPTVKEVRVKVSKLTPRKPKPKRAISGKGKKRRARPEEPPYEPTADEQSKMDVAERAIEEANAAIKSGGVFKIIGKCSDKDKRRWLDMLVPFVTFYNNLDKITGYK